MWLAAERSNMVLCELSHMQKLSLRSGSPLLKCPAICDSSWQTEEIEQRVFESHIISGGKKNRCQLSLRIANEAPRWWCLQHYLVVLQGEIENPIFAHNFCSCEGSLQDGDCNWG